MAGLREVRNSLLSAVNENIIDDKEFLLLYDVNKSRDDYPYWSYDSFNLDNLDDSESWSEFRFLKNDIYRLKNVLQIPDRIKTYNRLSADGIEALCIFLKRFAYPCRYFDFVSKFGRPIPDYCIMSNDIMNTIYGRFMHLLDDFNMPILNSDLLEKYCTVIVRKGSALQNCFGFIDGTVRAISRPGVNQKTVYNGHKKVHALKFQSVVLPNGIIAHMYGPVKGKRHECSMLRMSDLLTKLSLNAWDTNGNPLCLYGDLAYPLRIHFQCPFRNIRLTEEQQNFNKSMSQERVAAEWLFGDISNGGPSLTLRKILKSI